MGLEDELRATARRMAMRRALGNVCQREGLDVGASGDPIAELLRGAGMDVDADDVDGFYDAMLADMEEGV